MYLGTVKPMGLNMIIKYGLVTFQDKYCFVELISTVCVNSAGNVFYI